MSIGLRANRDCILNEIRRKLNEFDIQGIPEDHLHETDPRAIMLTAAAVCVYAIEEMDAVTLGDSI